MGLTLMAFRPRRPVTQEKGTFGQGLQVAWSTVEEVQEFPFYSPNEKVVFDAETVRATYRSRYGLNDRMDVEIEIPFLWAGAGGMDSFVEDFHDLFGLPKGGRDKNEDDQFEGTVVANGNEIYSLEGNSIGIQDIPIFLTYQLTEEGESRPAIATRMGIEIPTGSQSSGYGNGAFDYGAGVLGEKSFGRWTWSGALDFTIPGQSDRMKAAPGYSYDNQWSMQFGGEYRWDDSLSLIASSVWTSPMLTDVTLEEVNREIFDLGVGVAVDMGPNSRFAFSVHEDLVAATGSDIILQAGWVWGY